MEMSGLTTSLIFARMFYHTSASISLDIPSTMIPKSTDDFCSHAAVELGRKLFPLFALALDLGDDFFEDKTKSSAANMNMLHYPPQTGPVHDNVIGIGAHTECVLCIGISRPRVHCTRECGSTQSRRKVSACQPASLHDRTRWATTGKACLPLPKSSTT